MVLSTRWKMREMCGFKIYLRGRTERLVRCGTERKGEINDNFRVFCLFGLGGWFCRICLGGRSWCHLLRQGTLEGEWLKEKGVKTCFMETLKCKRKSHMGYCIEVWSSEERSGWEINDNLENNKVLLYSTGDYIQYPVINHNEREYKKECTYI